jgi:hypothetical protein
MSKDDLSLLEDEVLAHVFAIYPQFAVGLGLHEYDGLLPRCSGDSVSEWVERADELVKRLPSLDLSKPISRRALDAELLRMLLEGVLFDLTDLRVWSQEPLTYVRPLNIQPYIVRIMHPPMFALKPSRGI